MDCGERSFLGAVLGRGRVFRKGLASIYIEHPKLRRSFSAVSCALLLMSTLLNIFLRSWMLVLSMNELQCCCHFRFRRARGYLPTSSVTLLGEYGALMLRVLR